MWVWVGGRAGGVLPLRDLVIYLPHAEGGVGEERVEAVDARHIPEVEDAVGRQRVTDAARSCGVALIGVGVVVVVAAAALGAEVVAVQL